MADSIDDAHECAGAKSQTTVRFGALLGIKDLFVEYIISPFEAAHPHIRVEYIALENSGELLAALAAKRTDAPFDLIMLDLAFAKSATDDNLLAPFTQEDLPAMQGLAEDARIAGVAAVPVTSDMMALLYNPRLVDPAPRSWNDFACPAYAGRIAVADPPGLTGLGLTVIYDHIGGGLGGPDFAVGMDRIDALARGVRSFEHIDFAPLVASGEYAMTIGWAARTRQLLARSRATTLEVVVPLEGSMRQINTVGIVAGTQQPAAALQLLNFMIDEQAQTAIAEKLFYVPMNAGALAARFARDPMTPPPKDIGINMLDLAPYLQSITQAWKDRGIGR